jgi:hypothetical protein
VRQSLCHWHWPWWLGQSKEGKQSHYRPGQALRFPWVWGSLISRQLAHEDGKVVSPTQWPPLPPRKYSWYSWDRVVILNGSFRWLITWEQFSEYQQELAYVLSYEGNTVNCCWPVSCTYTKLNLSYGLWVIDSCDFEQEILIRRNWNISLRWCLHGKWRKIISKDNLKGNKNHSHNL